MDIGSQRTPHTPGDSLALPTHSLAVRLPGLLDSLALNTKSTRVAHDMVECKRSKGVFQRGLVKLPFGRTSPHESACVRMFRLLSMAVAAPRCPKDTFPSAHCTAAALPSCMFPTLRVARALVNLAGSQSTDVGITCLTRSSSVRAALAGLPLELAIPW